MGRKPKLLLISPVVPAPLQGGSQDRIWSIIKSLLTVFDIHLTIVIPRSLAIKEEETIEKYTAALPVSVQFIYTEPLSFSERVLSSVQGIFRGMPFHFSNILVEHFGEQMLKQGQADIILIEKCIMAALFLKAGLIEKFKDIPLVLDEGALHYIAYKREFKLADSLAEKTINFIRYLRFYIFSRKIVRFFARIMVVSEEERSKLKAFYAESKISLIPNGTYIEHATSAAGIKDLAILGPYDYSPNLHALNWFFENVFPELDKRGFSNNIYVIGANPPRYIRLMSLKDKRVIVRGHVQDLKKIYDKVSIVLCPVRKGGETRSKVLEAMAFGKVVVATEVGCEGIEVQHGKEVIITNTAEGFAEGIMSLLGEPDKVETLGSNALKFVEQKYQWSTVLKSLPEQLLSLVKEKE